MASTKRPGAEAALGGFAGLFDLKAAGFRDPLLLAATDGVGTKLKIAIACESHRSVGIDLVAMCVNDLVVQGAEPLFFLDYYATGQLEPGHLREVVIGIAEGCRAAGCALIGGETAELPGLYRASDYDIAGFAVGAAERDALLTGENVAAGDLLLGLRSSGLHSNGFSLVRRLIEDLGLDYASAAPFDPERSLGEALLTPTRIYTRACLAAIRAGGVKALSHITGGGFPENLPRVLPESLAAELDGSAWQPHPVFGWLAETGNISTDEMSRTFNCGLGMIVVVAPERIDDVAKVFADAGETVAVVGELKARAADAPPVAIRNLTFP